MSKIIGIYGGVSTHDPGAAYIENGKIIGVIQEEKLVRKKSHEIFDTFPNLSIDKIISQFNIDLKEIDFFCTSTPVGIPNSWWRKNNISTDKICVINHHTSHCAGAYYTSGFKEKTLIVSYDAGGIGMFKGNESTYGKIWLGENNKMNFIRSMPMSYSASIPCMYAMVTRWLGWEVNKDEGKVTGLAAYGKYNKYMYEAFEKLCWFEKESLNFIPQGKAESATGISIVLNYLTKINQLSREDLAYNMQLFLENRMMELFNYLHELYPDYKKIVVAGGVFANVKLNQRLNELDWVDEIYIYPAMNDAGLALGSALMKSVQIGERISEKFDDVFLGVEYSKTEVDSLWKKYSGIKRIKYDKKIVAKYLNDGNIIGWFKGRFEFGPRALGARSILVNPTEKKTHVDLNIRLGRDEIMPFAPIVLAEKANEVFVTNNKSHYTAEFMTLCYQTREEWIDKIPAVVHEIDKSARPQIVYKKNPFYDILVEYEKISKIPVLLNTSFNIHGEPIIDAPEQALGHLRNNVIDYLVIEDFIYYKG